MRNFFLKYEVRNVHLYDFKTFSSLIKAVLFYIDLASYVGH